MPNNASARRGKEKKNKDKKKKDSKKTDTPPLPKEDTASADSGTLSLSSAGQDKAVALPLAGKDVVLDLSDPRYLEKALAIWHKEKAKPKAGNSPSLSSKGQKEKQRTPLADQEFTQALGRMEEAIQKHATGEAGEPDWEYADWAWAITASG